MQHGWLCNTEIPSGVLPFRWQARWLNWWTWFLESNMPCRSAWFVPHTSSVASSNAGFSWRAQTLCLDGVFCLHAVVFSGSPFHAFFVWLSIFLSANSSWEEYRRKHVAWCQHGVLWSADVSNQLGAFTRVQFQTFWILTFGMMIPNDYIIFSFLFFLFPHQPELLRCGFPTGQFGLTWRPPSIKLCWRAAITLPSVCQWAREGRAGRVQGLTWFTWFLGFKKHQEWWFNGIESGLIKWDIF